MVALRMAMGLLAVLALSLAGTPARGQAEQDDPTRPVSTFDLRPHFEDNSVSTPSDRYSLILRRNLTWDFGGGWRLGARGDLPLALSNTVSTDNPGGGMREGIGRPLVSAYLADRLDDRWAFAFGLRLVAPASASTFGSGNWDAVPLLAVRALLPELSDGSYFLPQLRYVSTFAQSFSGRPSRNLQFSPQLKWKLPRGWFVTLFPSTDIRMNFGPQVAGQTGRLFLPLDAAVGRSLDPSTLVSLEVSKPIIDDYPVYRLKVELRLSRQL
jgi:hypothetical protein